MEKMRRARYTLEYKLESLRLISASQSIAAVVATLGLADQTLHNWIKTQREGRLGGPGSKPVSPEQMELARQRTSRGNRCEARVDRLQPMSLAVICFVRAT